MINEKLTNYQLKNISSNKTNNILFEEFECGKLYNTKNETTEIVLERHFTLTVIAHQEPFCYFRFFFGNEEAFGLCPSLLLLYKNRVFLKLFC